MRIGKRVVLSPLVVKDKLKHLEKKVQLIVCTSPFYNYKLGKQTMLVHTNYLTLEVMLDGSDIKNGEPAFLEYTGHSCPICGYPGQEMFINFSCSNSFCPNWRI
jgi:hypothetical protein